MLTGAIALALGGQAIAMQDEAPPEVQRPNFTFARYMEDWSVLRDVETDDPLDALKYVSLSDDGSVWASFGGHIRFRVEDWSNFGFGAPAMNDDTFVLGRATFHSDIHLSEQVRVFLEGKTALATDRDLQSGAPRTLDVDSLALEQAFVDFTIPLDNGATLTLRPGRQQFSLGRQRLVSPLPWANTMRRWDGIAAVLACEQWTVTGFWAQFAPVQKYSFNDPDSHTQVFGAYASRKVEGQPDVDLYFISLDAEGPATYNGTTGPEERHTIGARLAGPIGETAFRYDVEGAYQFGDVGPGDISAYMFAAEVSTQFKDAWAAPTLKFGFDYASGDDAAGGDVGTFNQLWPLGHAYYGFIDTVGRQNAIDLHIGVSGTPIERTTVGITGHFLWRAEAADALYHVGGGVVRAGAPGTSRDLGFELDLTVKHKINRHLACLFGYSRFFPGTFIDQTGPSQEIDFLYGQVQFTF